MKNSTHPTGDILQAFHDGELEATRFADVESHCAQCSTCQAELADLKKMQLLFAASTVPELPRTVWHRVRPKQASDARFRPAFGITAGALGIVLGLLIGPIQGEADQTESGQKVAESVDLWGGESASPLLAVYQISQN